MRIEVPILPPRELSPNFTRYAHWTNKSRARKILAQAVYFSAVATLNDIHKRDEDVSSYYEYPYEKARLTYTFFYSQNRKRDLDNLVASMKIAQDMLVKAGIIEADDWESLKYGDHNIVIDKKKSPLTIIEVDRIK